MGILDNMKKSYEQLKEAKWKNIGDYEKEEASKKEQTKVSSEKAEPVKKKRGGKVKCMAKGGGCEVRGKTKGRMV